MRRTVSALVAVAVLLSACQARESSAPSTPIVGAIEPGTPPGGGDAGLDAPPSTGEVGSSTTVGDGSPGAGAADLTSADGALAAYLAALAAGDLSAASAASVGSARELARMRAVVAVYNAELGGTSRSTLSDRAFTVARTAATRVTYTGSARLDTKVSGPDNPPYEESAQLADPVVALIDGGWRVSAVAYDGRPIEFRASSSNATVGGVNLRVQGALGFGVSTAVVVELATDGDHDIRLDGAELRYADGRRVDATFGVLVTSWPAFYFLFPRSNAAPTAWAAKVTIDEGTADAVSKDVVLEL